jgi:hypothetical protein
MRTTRQHLVGHASQIAVCATWFVALLMGGNATPACGRQEESCQAEDRLLAKLDPAQRTELERQGAVWIAAGVEDQTRSWRHLFLGSRLLDGCSTRLEVGAFLEAVMTGAPEVAARRESSGIKDQAIVTCVVSLWTTESFWVDGLDDAKSSLLDKGIVTDWVDLVRRLIATAGIDASITWALIDDVPEGVLSAVAGRLRTPGSECERLWAAALITNSGLRVGTEELTGVGTESPVDSESRQRLVKSMLAGEHVTWDALLDAGCWE